MKKMLMLLSACMMTISATTGILGKAFISCRNPKTKKKQTGFEEENSNFEYGSIQETNKFSQNDFDKYVEDSLTPIVSLLNSKFLDQSVDQENFDFITIFNSLQSKTNSCNSLIWNKQSVNAQNYCVDAFLADWTFSELDQKDIDVIKSNFVSRKFESKKQKIQNQLNSFKDIKSKKKLVKDKIKNIKNVIDFFNNDNFKKNIDIDSEILKFMQKILGQGVSPFFSKVKSRFEKIYNNFINGVNFEDIKDLTNVNEWNLISYIKKPENIKKMNENFKSKTDDEKALMLFMIKFNYMYKYISAPDGKNSEDGHFLFETLCKDINIVKDLTPSSIEKKFEQNGQKISENFSNYFKDIFENNNSEKSLEPFYCLVEGIMYIIKQKFYKIKIDQPIKNTEIKVENIFECICEFVSIIKDEKNNNQSKYFNIKNGKESLKDLLLESSLFEGIFIENESAITKISVSGGIAATGTLYATYCYLGMLGIYAVPLTLVGGGLASVAAWWYNKASSTSTFPTFTDDNLKNYYNSSFIMLLAKLWNDKANIAKMIDSFDFKIPLQNLLNDYRKDQDFQDYIQNFDKLKNIVNDKNNNFLKELQDFINHGGFKNILTDFFDLVEKIKSVSNNLTDSAKEQKVKNSVDNLFKSIGIDMQKKGEDVIINGSVLDSLINWINDPNNSIDKTFDGIIDLLEQDCNQWNESNFENQADNLIKVIKDKKDIKIEHVVFEQLKENDSFSSIIKLNYKLKILTTNEVYNIEFKNKNFKKFPKNFKISKFEKLT